ncbi:MAG: bifunctional phosphoribosyl-AMP cyclohydrolase/phosphoribosyl-ATP diphosphatase HisIE [Gammaproteobacteria bacterium]|nr:bifunctional phosphoribosyl-AMP cyclohydrolase/phosphoribosyl-ATP diphosphatase HisIE [Gammaproteobacteria bacterium]
MIVTLDNRFEIDFGSDGLVPVIAQDHGTGDVLMLAWATEDAIKESLIRGRAVFWSRSRKCLWEKGETSGNTLELIALHADCDWDTLLMLVRPKGPACHQGTLTCFADRSLTAPCDYAFLGTLEKVIDQRIRSADSSSYTSRMIAAGPKRLAQKVGEEGLETALALSGGDDAEATSEAADLVYHLAVALRARGLSMTVIVDELDRRHHSPRYVS